MSSLLNDEAVSEIIGIILIVVVTVLLATILASFAYGLGKGYGQQKFVAITVDRIDSTTISVSNAGGDIQVLRTDVPCPFIVMVNNNNVTALSGDLDETAGSYSTYSANTGAHVVVVGLYNDGLSHVLFEDTI